MSNGMGVKLIGVVLAITSASAQDQKPSARQEFEVASVKPTSATDHGGFWFTPGRFLARNVTVKLLIAIAYEIQPFQVHGGPAWMDTEHFDVEGTPENAGGDQCQETAMLKSLLEDRFKLVLHKEMGESSTYALVVGSHGPKLRPSVNQTPGAGPTGGVHLGPGTLVAGGMRLGLFASLLGTRLGRTVIDQTNLPERYDIDLRWTPDLEEPRTDPGDAALPAEPAGPSIFTAIQQQLGLKLESTKGPSGFFVIDKIEKPSAN
jgi:uncharacterized protein (TIGR03435 family)